MEIFGLLGLILVVGSYALLNTKYTKQFIIINIIGTILLVIHALLIEDWIFVFVNGFISGMWSIKLLKGGIK